MRITPCQRWEQRRARYRPSGERINPDHFAVEVIDRTTGADFTRTHHYSGTYVASRVDVALLQKLPFHRERLAGVAAFSVPVRGATITAWAGVAPAEGIELGRFVLLPDVAGDGESWFLARALRALQEALPHLCAVVSFSDPLPRLTLAGEQVKRGHIGQIYQALGAHYGGRSRARWLLIDPDAREVSPRTRSKLRNGEAGGDALERRYRDLGAPPRRPGESGRSYIARAEDALLQSRALRRLFHHGNHGFVFPLLDPDSTARIRREQKAVMAKGFKGPRDKSGQPLPLPYPRIPDTLAPQQLLFG